MFESQSIIVTSLGLALIVMLSYLIIMKIFYSWKKALIVSSLMFAVFISYSNMENPPDVKNILVETSQAMTKILSPHAP